MTLRRALVTAAQRWAAREPRVYRHELAVAAMFQDDGRFLREWVEFYRLQGATRIYLYDNLSTDGGGAVLAPYVAEGLVTLTDWPYLGTGMPQFLAICCGTYEDALERARAEGVKWLIVVDTDEFMFPTRAPDLRSFLRDFEDDQVGGVVAHWQLYGTSGVDEVPPDRLMIELLRHKAPQGFADNGYKKSIYRPHRVASIIDPHYASYREPWVVVNEHRRPSPGSVSEDITIDRVRVNHYWGRDGRYFRERKLERRVRLFGEAETELQVAQLARLEGVEDDAIVRFVPELRRRMGWIP